MICIQELALTQPEQESWNALAHMIEEREWAATRVGTTRNVWLPIVAALSGDTNEELANALIKLARFAWI